MILRAFYSSPLRSFVGSQEAAINEAVLGLLRIRHAFRVCWAFDELLNSPVDCVWSPLVEGEIDRARNPKLWTDGFAEDWCIAKLGFCNSLIRADSIPRKPGARSFCDKEHGWALDHGYQIISDIDIQMGTWDA